MLASFFKGKVYSAYRVKSMNPNEQFSIGELSKATGVMIVTIRYYERVKLMPTPPRSCLHFNCWRLQQIGESAFAQELINLLACHRMICGIATR
jgi:hypothetical protein